MELDAMNDEQLLAEAMKQGYNPEYQGDNKKSPREYLDVAFSHNKVLKERNESLSQTNEDLKQQIEELNMNMQRVIQFTQEQKQKAVDAAIKQLKAERKEAIADGDLERVENLDNEIDEQKKVAKNDSNPILEAWMRQNPWYLKDNELGIEADIIAKQLQDTGRFAPTDQDYQRLLEMVEKRVKSAFPDRFKNPKKDNPPDVESARQTPANNSSKKSYADLPPDAKIACDQFVADKIMTRERYLELYEWG